MPHTHDNQTGQGHEAKSSIPPLKESIERVEALITDGLAMPAALELHELARRAIEAARLIGNAAMRNMWEYGSGEEGN